MLKTIRTDVAITLEPPVTKKIVIWMHGLGADGSDFVPLVPQLNIPDELGIRFIFPHAPVRPVTLNNGMAMRAWYDIYDLSRNAREDHQGIIQSQRLIEGLIATEIGKGFAGTDIILAGFSQGGAMALQCGIRYPQPLAGLLILSAYLPLNTLVEQERHGANHSTPILMMHGTEDPIIPLSYAERSYEILKSFHYPIEWRTYPMAHSLCLEQIEDIRNWLLQRLS